jgi:rfaE bifunctional protein nucleotidyltransferase chain/domain
MESYLRKIRTLQETKEECNRWKESGKKIVFTNGCFDILHPGHVRYLNAARNRGDFLVVAINSDRSVRAIKEAGRPIVPEESRAEIIASLGFVDSVLIFDEDDPLKVIQYLLPDILVKGGDWEEGDIIGADAVKGAGGEVHRIPFQKGFSTTDIIKKIRNF